MTEIILLFGILIGVILILAVETVLLMILLLIITWKEHRQ